MGLQNIGREIEGLHSGELPLRGNADYICAEGSRAALSEIPLRGAA